MIKKAGDGVPFVRLMLLISSFAPLFFLQLIKGAENYPYELYFRVALAILLFFPFPIIMLIERKSKTNKQYIIMKIKTVTNNKEYMINYFLTVLFPLFGLSINNNTSVLIFFLAIGIVVYLHWSANIYYANLFYILRGYQIFTANNGNGEYIIISKNSLEYLAKKEKARMLRITNKLYICE